MTYARSQRFSAADGLKPRRHVVAGQGTDVAAALDDAVASNLPNAFEHCRAADATPLFHVLQPVDGAILSAIAA